MHMLLKIILIRNARVLNKKEWIPAGGNGTEKAMYSEWWGGKEKWRDLTETESSN